MLAAIMLAAVLLMALTLLPIHGGFHGAVRLRGRGRHGWDHGYRARSVQLTMVAWLVLPSDGSKEALAISKSGCSECGFTAATAEPPLARNGACCNTTPPESGSPSP